MSWKKTGLTLGIMALVGVGVETYKRQYVLNQQRPITEKKVETLQPVQVTFPNIKSLPDAFEDTDYQTLARVVLSETDGLGSYAKVAEITWNRYLEKRESGESLADFVYNKPNVFKAIHNRVDHWTPMKSYSAQTINDVLKVSYNQTLREQSTGLDHFDHIRVPYHSTLSLVEKYANTGVGVPVKVHDWMKKGTIKVFPHIVSNHSERIFLIASDNYN